MATMHRSADILRQVKLTQLNKIEDNKAFKEIRIPSELEVEVFKISIQDARDLDYDSKNLMEVLRLYGSKVLGIPESKIQRETPPIGSRHKLYKEKAKIWLVLNWLDHFFYCFNYKAGGESDQLGIKLDFFDFFTENKIRNQEDVRDGPAISIEEYIKIIFDFFKNQRYLDKAEFDIVGQLQRLFKLIERVGNVNLHNDAHFAFPYKVGLEFANTCDKYLQSFQVETMQSMVRVLWRNVSSGELAFLNLFARIIYGVNQLHHEKTNSEKIPKTIFLLIDEGDHGFHPQWQKSFVEVLIEFLKYFDGIKFQIMLTSHSPIVLSDLPKSHVIFLNKESGNTSVQKRMEMSQTFGANIHSLFRDSFFIRDGLVGSFAKKKIDELYVRTQDAIKLSPSEFKRLSNEIDLIGEPILRKSLQEKLLSIRGSDQLIDFYEKEIERLKSQNSGND